MAQNMLGSIEVNFVDKRRAMGPGADSQLKTATGSLLMTANATGTTTTAVGALATPATGTNAIRIGDTFKLFTAANVLKEEKVFTVTAIAIAASQTVTYAPASAVASVNTDKLIQTGADAYEDEVALDAALNAFSNTTYSAANLRLMTQNDKVWAVRTVLDPGSI